MKILIVDDNPSNRKLLEKMLQKNHQTVSAEDGQQAIIMVGQENPDIILMDMMMPVMDGAKATKYIREHFTEKWIPIIILSALSEEKDIIVGLDAGADDYLTKPFNQKILQAKLNTAEKSIFMQQQLMDYKNHNEYEQHLTKDIYDHLLQYTDFEGDYINSWLKPSKNFSGDLIASEYIEPKRRYFMLADSTGHGLAASISTIIVNQVFHSMAKKQFSIPCIAREINRHTKTGMPTGRFSALILGCIDYNNNIIEIWNGGSPDVLVFNNNNDIIHCFESKHVAAGILSDNSFDNTTDIWQWQEPCELFAYSDGLTDVLDDNHKELGEETLIEILKTPTDNRIEHLKTKITDFMSADIEQDDISCLSLFCD